MWYVSNASAQDDWSIQLNEDNLYMWCWLGDIFDMFYDHSNAGIRIGDRLEDFDTLYCPTNWILA